MSYRSLFIWKPKENDSSTLLPPEQKSKEFIIAKPEKKSKRKLDDDSDDDFDSFPKGKKSQAKEHNGKSKTSLKKVKG